MRSRTHSTLSRTHCTPSRTSSTQSRILAPFWGISYIRSRTDSTPTLASCISSGIDGRWRLVHRVQRRTGVPSREIGPSRRAARRPPSRIAREPYFVRAWPVTEALPETPACQRHVANPPCDERAVRSAQERGGHPHRPLVASHPHRCPQIRRRHAQVGKKKR